ncbi:HPP family protein [Cohnella thermotolerans]|uniref:HPP family protein n=1 Tax=Cohnella thermotolerans TaxID=329858 RepID=UPI00047DEA3D|nr:HPP family protein [Cohnella thermotolerans]
MTGKDEAIGYWAKMRGTGRSPLKVAWRTAAIAAAGGIAAIAVLAGLSDWTSAKWIMAPFGASCVLAFGLWDSPLAQPRNIIGGHLLSTLVGLVVYHGFGAGPVGMAVAVGLAIGLMVLTKTTHPPAGADPIVVMTSGSGWSFLFAPVLLGAIVIVLIALLFNNLDPKRRYPTFWL